MQLTNAPDEKQFPLIETALHSVRLQRYMPAAGKDKTVAFQYYLWNCAISESFYLSLHFSEIVCRNALHQALLARGDEKWFENSTFRNILEDRFRRELDDTVAQEWQDHGEKLTSHHIVASLTFGFWEHLTTKRFERFLWSKGVHKAFPNAPKGATYEDLHSQIEIVRRWRNRIAHHRSIFDKGPMRKHQEAIDLIKWVCLDTANWVIAGSKVPAAIALRPKP
ncbi:hypothetical protein EFV37_04540 [Mesorhizobium loti]|uniref:Uncharacterized protein n=1 Tax=Mesorhizobium jarvisii TaxID=1777867 RepID=A0A6M7TA99_9HYPH|nr:MULTISPECIES: Abi family protein [Mesorhizobium]OBQ76978.1 hypothetical protein A9K72_08325 [Mesorhizobium loti]QKC61652.1 hypothetical protein EB229_04540 [Mesorhizobium jarvisii]QKD07561.1 hypothetical protein EFV37_04540 [Mesorhizobium loti]RJT35331.1 hypothetical protein D3242_07510 [Mesorhizobium jarvisii]BCG98970.1 hypothetical protein MesoLj131b_09700 [Mesorhizobium sp. 131-2-5]